jgi:hypothetical protein
MDSENEEKFFFGRGEERRTKTRNKKQRKKEGHDVSCPYNSWEVVKAG